MALKTDDPQVAIARARQLLPPADDECTWLRHLSRVGLDADRRLRKIHAAAQLTWRTLWDEFLVHANGQLSRSSEWSYERWARILAETAEELQFKSEDILHREALEQIAQKLIAKYISARRMVVFYKRMWRCLGLGENLWAFNLKSARTPDNKAREFYRRLSIQEIETVHSHLLALDRELADMIVIGYSTGLRLSDVAELDASEVNLATETLEIVPNKTRHCKPMPLRIPLTAQALSVIANRLADIDAHGYLFSTAARKRPSRRISAAFRKCDIRPLGKGRASFHSLRATFISLMDEAGVPPHITDSITGHAGGGMHARYSQPTTEALRTAVRRAIKPLGS